MSFARIKLLAAGGAQAAYAAATIIPATASLVEGSPEDTAIGIVTLSNGAAGTAELSDTLGGKFKMGAANQLQAGATPTVYAGDPTTETPGIRWVDAYGTPKLGGVAVSILDDGAAPSELMSPYTTWDGTDANTGFGSGSPAGSQPTATVYSDSDSPEATLALLASPDHQHISATTRFYAAVDAFDGDFEIAAMDCLWAGNVYPCEHRGDWDDGHGRFEAWGSPLVDMDAITGVGKILYFFRARHSLWPLVRDRVVGPYTCYKQPPGTRAWAYADGLHDADVTVNPDNAVVTSATGNWQSIGAAVTWLNNNNYQSGRITITKTGTYTDAGGTSNVQTKGRHKLTVAPGITATLKANTQFGVFRFRGSGLHYVGGPNGAGGTLRFDLAETATFYSGGDNTPIFAVYEGCEFFNSNGYAATLRGATWQAAIALGWFIGCTFNDMASCITGPLARNCTWTDCANDFNNSTLLFTNNRIVNGKNAQYRDAVANMSLAYSGGGSATWQVVTTSGANDNSNGINSNGTTNHMLRLTDPVNGTQDFSFTTYYWADDVAAQVSLLTGWTAAPLSPGGGTGPYSRRSAAMGGFNGRTTAPAPVTATPVTITSSFDIHADGHQPNSGTAGTAPNLPQNRIHTNNIFVNCGGITAERIDIPVYGLATTNNVYIVNNEDETYTSSLQPSSAPGVRALHNTIIGQGLAIGAGWGNHAYSQVYANAIGGEANGVQSSATGLSNGSSSTKIDGNHSVSGATTGATNGSTGGTRASLWPDYATGDATPDGALLSNLMPRKKRFDVNGDERAANDAKGAVRIAA